MSKDVQRVCKQCDVCRQRSCRYQVLPLQPVEPPNRPGQRWHIDFTTLVSGTQQSAAAVAVDAFSRWVIVLPAKNQDAKTALMLMRAIYAHSGMPQQITTDSGTHFVCREFQQKMGAWGIEHTVCTPYMKSANGLAERAIGVMQDVVSKYCKQHEVATDKWHTIINDAMMGYNTCPHMSLGLRSPFEVERGVPYSLRGMETAREAPLDEYWQKVRADIMKAQKDAADRSMSSRTAKFDFHEGDKVWIQYQAGMHQRKRKLDMPNSMRGTIIRFKHRSVIVELETGKQRAVPVSMLQPRFEDVDVQQQQQD
jgi:ribosomal protein L21E